MRLSRRRSGAQKRTIEENDIEVELRNGFANVRRRCERKRHLILSGSAVAIASLLTLSLLFFTDTVNRVVTSLTGSDSAQALLNGGNMKNSMSDADVTSDTLPNDFYLLLLGVDASDSRRDGEEAAVYQVEQGGEFRADSITLAHIDTENQNVTLCSFDRDLKSIIQGYEDEGYRKLNTAYALGGVETMKAEVEELTGISIDYAAVVDMSGLDAVVDTIGGIDVEIEESFYDEVLDDGFKESGVQHLDGQQALVYARSRHPFDDGTLTRARHQRMILQAIGAKVSEFGMLDMYNTAQIASQYIGTDLSLQQMCEIANKLSGMDWDEQLYSYELPHEGCMDGEVWFSFIDRDEWQRVLHALYNNDGKLPTDEELAELDQIELDTDAVFVDESGYYF